MILQSAQIFLTDVLTFIAKIHAKNDDQQSKQQHTKPPSVSPRSKNGNKIHKTAVLSINKKKKQTKK